MSAIGYSRFQLLSMAAALLTTPGEPVEQFHFPEGHPHAGKDFVAPTMPPVPFIGGVAEVPAQHANAFARQLVRGYGAVRGAPGAAPSAIAKYPGSVLDGSHAPIPEQPHQPPHAFQAESDAQSAVLNAASAIAASGAAVAVEALAAVEDVRVARAVLAIEAVKTPPRKSVIEAADARAQALAATPATGIVLEG